jgi:hypothetical protein
MGAKGLPIARVKPGKRFFADFSAAASAGGRIGNLSAACKRVLKKQAEKNIWAIFLPKCGWGVSLKLSAFYFKDTPRLPGTCIFGAGSALSRAWAGSMKTFSAVHFSSSIPRRRTN